METVSIYFIFSQALLELLDQVEDVISVEDSGSDKVEESEDVMSVQGLVSDKVEEPPSHIQDTNNDELTAKAGLSAKGVGTNHPEVTGLVSNCSFLVLEVFFTSSTALLTKDMNFSEIDLTATYLFIR